MIDWLMPAGSGLLVWAAVRARWQARRIVWLLGIGVLLLVGGQAIAVMTGLASGVVGLTGWKWTLVTAVVAGYTLAVQNAARENASFLTLAVHTFGVILIFNLVDWMVLERLIFSTITPSFVVIPGSTGAPAYKDYGFMSAASSKVSCSPPWAG